MKNLLMTITSLLLTCILFNPVAKSQITTVNDVVEEVILRTDRDLYLSGETIWFSADVLVKDNNVQLSNVLYIELYQNNQAVVKKKFQIVAGKVQGMITIPEELPSANYYVRTYTQYQRNFPPETFFTSLLTIINPEIPIRKSKTRPVKLIEIVSEGGQLLGGLPSKTTVRLNNNLVTIIEQSLLIDQYKNKVDSVQFAANGLSLIEFTPNDSLDYFLMFKLNTGDTINEPLPKISQSGIMISENLENNEINFYSSKIYRISNKPNHLFVVYSTKGNKKFELAVTITEAVQTVTFDTQQLDVGIHYLVLFNTDGEVAAHTSFYQPGRPVKINLSTQKEVFKAREQVQLTLNPEQDNLDILKGLSVSVIKRGTFFSDDQELPLSIIDNPLLLDEFVDRLSDTESSITRQIKAALILNRDAFNIKKIQNAAVEKSEWLPETRDVSLSGIIRDKKTRKVLPGVWIYASVLGTDAQFHAYKSREDGSFIFSLNQLNNTHDISLTIDSIPGIEAEFLIYNDFSDNWPVAKNIPLQIDSNRRVLLESMFVNYQLTKMFKQKETVKEQKANSIPFPFTDLQASISLQDFVALPSMQEVLNELVPYVNVRKRKGEHVFVVVDQNRKNVYEKPLILVDNLPVFNVDEILAINPAKVERIDVIGKVYSFGDLFIEGIVMIHTKTDDFAGIQLPSASVFVEYQTITPSAAVQFPVYNPQNETPVHSPDFKNLLYWNPFLPFQKPETTINFYTADELAEYEIIVRGRTADGRPVFGKHVIRVTNF